MPGYVLVQKATNKARNVWNFNFASSLMLGCLEICILMFGITVCALINFDNAIFY